MEVKIKEIKTQSPCRSGLVRLRAWAGKDPETVVSLREILENNGVRDAYWALRCWPAEVYRPLLVTVAELVLPAWHRVYPDDDRPRRAIDAARRGDADAMAAACYYAWVAALAARADAWEDARVTAANVAEVAWEVADARADARVTAVAAVNAGASWDQLGALMCAWLENMEKEGK